MNIDCTLFVQMGNFFIAYLIMRWFLFKPAIAIIQTEYFDQKKLIHTIQSLESSVELAHHEQAVLWSTFHATVASDLSSIQAHDHVSRQQTMPPEQNELSADEYSHLIAACARHIIDKVDHVRK